jgi:hypothetical protein
VGNITPVPVNTPTDTLPVQPTAQWGALTDLRIAYISLCDNRGGGISSSVVEAVMTDGDFTVESQYQTPFENSNPENRLPNLLGMAQSGEASAALGRIAENIGSAANATNPEKAAGLAAAAARKLAEATGADVLGRAIGSAFESLQGKTNLTKINSTQVFVSTGSVRMSVTLFFMALKDAKTEVEDQINLLQQWALPQELSGTGLLESILSDGLAGLFPSTVPPFVNLVYSGKSYKPFLIESVSVPITGPIDKHGNRLSATVTLSLISRQAWDKNSVAALYAGGKSSNAN